MSMNRKACTTLLALVTVLLSAGVFAAVTNAEEAPPKPNVVLLFTDDMGWGDTASYGHPYIQTPAIDELAAEGQRWTDFYVPSPVCSPSRGALLTGKQPLRTGLYGAKFAVMFPGDKHYGMPAEELTLAEGLKSVGYATGIFGKWHLGDAPEFLPTRHGFDYWYGVPYSNDMNFKGRASIDELYQMQLEGRVEELQKIFKGLFEGYQNPDFRNYEVPLWRSRCDADGCQDTMLERPVVQPTFTRRLTEEAIAFMEEHRDEPFFVYLPYSMPHLPIFASDSFSGKSLAGAYGDTIEEIDWSVGEIRRALDDLGLSDNTLVIFSSDNGPWQAASTLYAGSAGPLRGSKQEVYEGGVRVPGVFSWPGRVRPQLTNDIGSVMDVYATVMKLAGAELPGNIDGVDLSPVLFEGAEGPRTELAFYYRGVLRAYRYGNYKLHLYGVPKGGEPLDVPELYDLHQDVSEREDLAADHPAVVKEILEAIERHREQTPRKPPIFDARFEGITAGS